MRQLDKRSGRHGGAAAVLVIAAASIAVGVSVAQARPDRLAAQKVELHLVGHHAAGASYHEGTFTATAPLCSSGSWLGDSEEEGDGIRDFTCDDKSGTFTADFTGTSEHQTGATAPWAITDGTGKWKNLRGAGMAMTDQSTGPEELPIDFTSTWTGVVDFDARGPSIRFTSAKVVKSGSKWKATVAFTSFDNVRSNTVGYRVTATSDTFFAVAYGTVKGGQARVTFAIPRSEAGRTVLIRVHVFDPWQNESAKGKLLKLA